MTDEARYKRLQNYKEECNRLVQVLRARGVLGSGSVVYQVLSDRLTELNTELRTIDDARIRKRRLGV